MLAASLNASSRDCPTRLRAYVSTSTGRCFLSCLLTQFILHSGQARFSFGFLGLHVVLWTATQNMAMMSAASTSRRRVSRHLRLLFQLAKRNTGADPGTPF